MDWEQTVILTECGHVQAVIARKSEARMKYRSWLYTLLSAATIAAYSNKLEFSKLEFFVLIMARISAHVREKHV